MRRGALGSTVAIGGICGSQKYSIIEYSGFNQIQNAAHELGHRFHLLLINKAANIKHLINFNSKSWCNSRWHWRCFYLPCFFK